MEMASRWSLSRAICYGRLKNSNSRLKVDISIASANRIPMKKNLCLLGLLLCITVNVGATQNATAFVCEYTFDGAKWQLYNTFPPQQVVNLGEGKNYNFTDNGGGSNVGLYGGYCIGLIGTATDTLIFQAKAYKAKSFTGFDDACNATGTATQLVSTAGAELTRGGLLSFSSPDFFTGEDLKMRVLAYYPLVQELQGDLSQATQAVCKKLQPL
jgi:hypothetical protein